jgi:hypothetical protein
MKYLIQKGFRGFGDRLRNLVLCVKIAIEQNRKIYVDWNDFYWNHTGENFYTYFEILDIGIDNIDNVSELTVYPDFWKDKLNIPLSPHNFCDGQKEHISSLSKIIKKYPQEDIIVIPNSKHSDFTQFLFFAKIFRVKDIRITNRVKELQNKYNLKECIGIHLRGTDRKDKNVTNKRIISDFVNSDNTSLLFKKYKDKLLCFTDDIELYIEFKKIFPRAILLTQIIIFDQNSTSGTHTIPNKFLKHTKDEMNVDLITDFFALASCKQSFSTCKESLFLDMSQKLHPYVDIILGNGK